MKRISLVLMSLLLLGCASIPYDLYGVKIDGNWEDEKNFVIHGFDGKNVDRTLKGSASDEVTAWGRMDRSKIVLTIKNHGRPIITDYFFDTFTLVTKQREVYELEKEDVIQYHYRADEVIRTNGTAVYVFKAPQGVLIGDVEKIVCQLGLLQGARVVLKPLPEIGDIFEINIVDKELLSEEPLEGMLEQDAGMDEKDESLEHEEQMSASEGMLKPLDEEEIAGIEEKLMNAEDMQENALAPSEEELPEE